MANAVNRDITGCVVLISAACLRPEFADPETRKFRVGGGFGASSVTAGTKVYGTWVSDGEGDVVDGYDIEALVEEAPEPAPANEGPVGESPA